MAKILVDIKILVDKDLPYFPWTSHFLYKPEIEISQICYNAYSKNCGKCEEPECGFSGMKFTKKSRERLEK